MRKNELRYRKGGYRLSFEVKTLREVQGVKSKRCLSLRGEQSKKHVGKVNATCNRAEGEEQEARKTAGRFLQ